MSTGTGWKTYRDFVLKIEPAGEGRYRVEAQAPTGEAKATFEQPFDERDLELFLLKVGHPRKVPTRRLPEQAQDAVEFGARLYGAVICGQVRDLFARARYDAARSDQGLRVQLRLSDAPELADWPWEFLNDGREFLALSADTPVVRYLDLPAPPRPIQVQPPLRILVTVSAPQGLPELNAEQEKAKLLESLAALSERGAVTVDFTLDATLRTLQGTLRRARSRQRSYHVWHYIGHGAFMRSRSASVLAFCTPEGLLHRVGDLELGTLFDGYPEMRLVLLNACEGARPDPQDPFAGVAAALVRNGVPAVIGMQIEISDEAARTLSQVFYEALVDGLPVDAALTEARRAVFFAPNWTEWATPVLYMRAPDGRIFDVAALAPAGLGQPAQASEAEVAKEKARQERLATLYTEALEAFYAARWGRSVGVLDEIVSLQADYRRAAPMLEEARRQHALAESYVPGRAAFDAQDWVEAIQHLEAVVALDAGYQDAADKLQEARRQKELVDLYADARQLYQAQRWQAAIQVLERIQALQPDYPDSEGLLDSARVALDAQEFAHKLATLYSQGLEHIDAREWSEALQALEQVARLEQSYRETDTLLARVRRELEAERHAQKLTELYNRGLEHIGTQEWSEALECLQKVGQLEQGYRETDALLMRVRQELEAQDRARKLAERYDLGMAAYGVQNWAEAIQHLEAVVALDAGYRNAADRLQEARRQRELAELYTRARQLQQTRRWQAAIQLLERIQALEPAYPDPEGLLDSARVALEAGEQAHKLAGLYSRGVEHIKAQEWPQALRCLEQVAEVDQGYRRTDALLAQVRRELAPARPGTQPSAKPGIRSWPVWVWVFLGAAALLLLGGGALGIRYALARSATRTRPTREAGATGVRPKDGASVVYVPAGTFWMGSDEGDSEAWNNEKPIHRVHIDAFWIDCTEVTNAQYKRCVEAAVCSPPQSRESSALESYYGNSQYGDYPVVNVTWDQARTYAEWVGGRLPTEAEWEYAASGPDGLRYPWGDDPPTRSRLNYGGLYSGTRRVGSYPIGRSWCGAFDMSGNVWEWTSSLYVDYPYNAADGREDPDADGGRVARGGSFSSNAIVVRCAARLKAAPTLTAEYMGFRVVVDAR